MAKSKIDWSNYDSLLGTMSDYELAKQIGCSIPTVYWRRKKLNIQSFNSNYSTPIDWDEIIPYLGKLSDNKIAKKFNCSVTAVTTKRNRLNIEPVQRSYNVQQYKLNWDVIDPHIGTMTDKAIAQLFNCSPVSITLRRKKLGIKCKGQDQYIDWSKYDHLLNSMSIPKLCNIIGCRYCTVKKRKQTYNNNPEKIRYNLISSYIDPLIANSIKEIINGII